MVFALILLSTIGISRIVTQWYNPNPVLFGYEFHHFDYGMILLVIAVLTILFSNARQHALSLIVTGIGLGLILDEWWFVRDSVPYSNAATWNAYQSSAPAAVLLAVVLILVLLTTRHFSSRKKGR